MQYKPKGKLAALDFVFQAGVLGAKLGFVVAGLYSVAIMVLFTALFTWAAVRDWLFPSEFAVPIGVIEVLMLSFSVLLVASVIGVLPGTLLGAITAMFTAIPLFLLRHRLSMRGATVLGVGIALLIAIVVHPFAAPSLLEPAEPPLFTSSSPSWDSYLLFLGVPSIFYIASNGYGSRRLFKRDLESRQGAA